MPGSADAGEGTGGTADVTKAISASALPSNIPAIKIADGTVSDVEFQLINSLTSNVQTQLDAKLTNVLTDGNFFIGNSSNIVTSVNPSGDVDISNTGVFTIGALKVINGMLAGSIALSKLLTPPEANATADQTDAEIETAFNNQVAVVSQADAESGISSNIGQWTPERVKQAIDALGGILSDAEVKIAYENNADTNEYDDAEQTKLAGIETAADVTDLTNVNAALATIVGTIGTGVWEGTPVESAFLDADTMHLGVAQTVSAVKTHSEDIVFNTQTKGVVNIDTQTKTQKSQYTTNNAGNILVKLIA